MGRTIKSLRADDDECFEFKLFGDEAKALFAGLAFKDSSVYDTEAYRRGAEQLLSQLAEKVDPYSKGSVATMSGGKVSPR